MVVSSQDLIGWATNRTELSRPLLVVEGHVYIFVPCVVGWSGIVDGCCVWVVAGVAML